MVFEIEIKTKVKIILNEVYPNQNYDVPDPYHDTSKGFENVFKKVDYILTPSTPTTSFELGKKQDPLTMYLNDIFTVPASLAGLPGISLPVGLDKLGLPIGIQLIANAFDEPGLISTAHVLEKSANFNFIADGAAK